MILCKNSGGSGLAVLGPPPSSSNRNLAGGVFDKIVQQASNPNEEEKGPLPISEGEGNSRRITLYRNGFTVDDGPLRDLTSPESRAFIATLENGDVPLGKCSIMNHLISEALVLYYE